MFKITGHFLSLGWPYFISASNDRAWRETMPVIVRELAQRFTKGNHAFVVCTHTDKAHIHNHIIWSAVNLE